jgi:hypothetical protein
LLYETDRLRDFIEHLYAFLETRNYYFMHAKKQVTTIFLRTTGRRGIPATSRAFLRFFCVSAPMRRLDKHEIELVAKGETLLLAKH